MEPGEAKQGIRVHACGCGTRSTHRLGISRRDLSDFLEMQGTDSPAAPADATGLEWPLGEWREARAGKPCDGEDAVGSSRMTRQCVRPTRSLTVEPLPPKHVGVHCSLRRSATCLIAGTDCLFARPRAGSDLTPRGWRDRE